MNEENDAHPRPARDAPVLRLEVRDEWEPETLRKRRARVPVVVHDVRVGALAACFHTLVPAVRHLGASTGFNSC